MSGMEYGSSRDKRHKTLLFLLTIIIFLYGIQFYIRVLLFFCYSYYFRFIPGLATITTVVRVIPDVLALILF